MLQGKIDDLERVIDDILKEVERKKEELENKQDIVKETPCDHEGLISKLNAKIYDQDSEIH